MGTENLRRLFLVVAILVFVSITSISYLQRSNSIQARNLQLMVNHCRGPPTNDTITPVKGSKAFFTAAYFENRFDEKNATRVIGIVHHKDVELLFCWFCCTINNKIRIAPAIINNHSDRFGFPYGPADLYCWEPQNCQPRFLFIHDSDKDMIEQQSMFEIKNREATVPSVQFTLCVSPMHKEYNNTLQFIQSMEMYKILGVDKVVIYKVSCSQLMEEVLNFYVREGTVEVISWPISFHLYASVYWHSIKDYFGDIGYYGQIAALNDCVYRNMYKSKYVLLNDVDEIILPVKHWNWETMMRELQEQHPESGAFLFDNLIFQQTVFTTLNQVNISSWKEVPGINILEHVHREPDQKNVINPTKMIVDPTKVVQTSVHSLLRSFGTVIKAPLNVAFVYHCRVPLQNYLPNKDLIKDTTIWRFNTSLIENVNKVLQRTVFTEL